MAVITYADLFDRLKVLIHYFNELEARQVSESSTNLPLPYIKNQILVPFESQDKTQELNTIEQDFANAILAEGSLKLSIITWAENILSSVASALGVHTPTATEILSALADAMVRDSQTINARELEISASDIATDGTIEPHSLNTGTGKLAYTFLRPGLSPSETADAQTIQCKCISSVSPQQELFQLSGAPNNSRDSHLGQGSGLGPTMVALGASVSNGDFEDWTGAPLVADNWTATVGAWGTEISQEVSTVFEGTYSVVTDYVEGDWKITTPLPITLQPDTVYAIVLAIRKVASATGTLRFGLSNGTAVAAYVAGCVKSVSVAALTTDYAIQYLCFKTPAVVSAAWTLGISMDTPGVANIFFDLLQFGIMTVFNDMRFCIFSGATGFGLGDRFGQGSESVGFSIIEAQPGIVQKFIGRCFDTQLPSATGAAETIADPT